MAEFTPGGRKSRIPNQHKGDYMPSSQIERLSGQKTTEATVTKTPETDSIFSQIPEKINDPFLVDLPEGAAISTGPYTQDGIYIIGAPKNTTFKFDQTIPNVDGKLISRHGKLWIKNENGELAEPPEHLKMFGWATTRKTYRLLPTHFNGADSAKPLPNFKIEEWVFE
jgi:hypothetical protein